MDTSETSTVSWNFEAGSMTMTAVSTSIIFAVTRAVIVPLVRVELPDFTWFVE